MRYQAKYGVIWRSWRNIRYARRGRLVEGEYYQYGMTGAAARANASGDKAAMAIIGLILNFLGGAILIYYGDKTGAAPDRATKDFLLSRWLFYSGIVSFCVGFFLILISMVF